MNDRPTVRSALAGRAARAAICLAIIAYAVQGWLSAGTFNKAQAAYVLLAALTAGASAAPIAQRWSAIGGVGVALGGFWYLLSIYAYVPYPQLHWPNAMSGDAARGLYIPGLILILASVRVAPAPRRRWGIRLAGAAGCAAVLLFWLLPQSFVLDHLDESDRASVPVVIDGLLEQRAWSRDLIGGSPLMLVPNLAYTELLRADISHGMTLDSRSLIYDLIGPIEALARQRRLGALYAAQKGLAMGLLYLSAGAVVVLAPLGAALLLGLGLPRLLWRGCLVLLWGITVSIPMTNLLLLLVYSRLSTDALTEPAVWNAAALALLLLTELSGRALRSPA